MQMQSKLGQCSSVIITFILLSSYTVFFLLNITVLSNQRVTIMFCCMLSGYKKDRTYLFVGLGSSVPEWRDLYSTSIP